MKTIYLMFAVATLVTSAAQAGKIEDCYAQSPTPREATYCADRELALAVQDLQKRLSELESKQPSICKLVKIPGFRATLVLGKREVQVFNSAQYSSWEELINDAIKAGQKLERAGRCTFID